MFYIITKVPGIAPNAAAARMSVQQSPLKNDPNMVAIAYAIIDILDEFARTGRIVPDLLEATWCATLSLDSKLRAILLHGEGQGDIHVGDLVEIEAVTKQVPTLLGHLGVTIDLSASIYAPLGPPATHLN